MNFKKCALIFLCLVVLTSLSFSQSAEVATFVGTVFDSESSPLPGVEITAKNILTGLSQSTITNRDGRYRIERLPRGVYAITASVEGFKTLTKEGIELFSGAETRVDFVLELGELTQEVTVIGEAPMVETTRSQVSTVITEKELLSLPQADRNFLSLIDYAPGVLPGNAVAGIRGEQNTYSIDGHNNEDLTDRGLNINTLPPEAIQEFKLISSNFSAEYNADMGGILNVVMKSGTNELHGSGWVFYRGDSSLFRSADWLTGERAPYERSQYGATLGGPIKKDKTFFYMTFEGINQKIDNISPLYVFTPEAISQARGSARQMFDRWGADYPVPTYDFIDANDDGVPDYGRTAYQATEKYNSYNAGLKIEHIFSPKDRMSFRYLFNYNKLVDYYPRYWVPGKPQETPRDFHTLGLTWLHIINETSFNELRVGWHTGSFHIKLSDVDVAYFQFQDEPVGVGEAGWTQKQRNHTFQIADVFNFQKGNHNIKIGGEARYWLSLGNYSNRIFGDYTYNTGLDWIFNQGAYSLRIGADPPDPAPGNPFVVGDYRGEWRTGFGLSDKKWRGWEFGLFVQDDWRLSDRLTLALGLRWDYYSVPKEYSGAGFNNPAPGTQEGFETLQLIEGVLNDEGVKYMMFDGRELMGKGIWDPYSYAFSPKISFAYDLTGDGKTSLRSGFGISYGMAYNRNFENDRFNYPDFAFVTFYGEDRGYPPLFPSLPLEIPLENAKNYRVSLRWMEPKLKPMIAYQWLVGIQRQVFTDFSIELNYSGTAGRRIGNLQRPNRFTGDGADGRITGINPQVAINDANTRENQFSSNYHAVQIVLNKRYSNGWSWYSAYTWSRSKDYASNYQSGYAVANERREMEYGWANYDRRHRLVGGFVYDFPFFKTSKNWILKNVIGGWELAGAFQITSGARFNVQAASSKTDYNLDGMRGDRPLWLGGDNYNDAIDWSSGEPHLDENLFATPTPPAYERDMSYYDQNFLPRNAFTGPWTYNLDLSLKKNFLVPVGAKDVTLQFIIDVFNVFKSQFWALPVTRYDRSSFGDVTRKNGERIGQISLRFIF